MSELSSQESRKDPVSRLCFALQHPLRRRILSALVAGRGSASMLSKDFGQPLSRVTYHLSDILDRECKVVEVVERIPRGGANETLYAVKVDAFTGVLPWTEFPEPLRSGLRGFSFDAFWAAATACIDAGSVDSLDGSRLTWKPVEVDRHGWMEICDGLEGLDRKVGTAVAKTRKRRRKSSNSDDLLNVIVGVAAFEATTRRSSARA